MKEKPIKYLKNTYNHFYYKFIKGTLFTIFFSYFLYYIIFLILKFSCNTNENDFVQLNDYGFFFIFGCLYVLFMTSMFILYTNIRAFRVNIYDDKIEITYNKLFSKSKSIYKFKNLQHLKLVQSPSQSYFGLKTVIAYTPSGTNHNLRISNIDKDIADELFLFLEDLILNEEFNGEL